MNFTNESTRAILNLHAFCLVSALSLVFCSPAARAQSGVQPQPGDISISELMFDSVTAVDDNDGEYFEVTNTSYKILDFSGLYIQDTETLGSTTAPYVKIPSGALPLLYPGETFVFARSDNPALNGGIPVVHYCYSVTVGSPTPADKSKVSHTAMSFNNSAVDSIAITSEGPFNMGGSVIEMVTYDPTKAPFNSHVGIGFERANLLNPFAAGNVAASTATFGTVPQAGTPGMHNSNDTTLYPCYYKYTAVAPDSADIGILTASGAASIKGGNAILKFKNGKANELYGVAVSPQASELPLLGGTVLVDLLQADIWAIDSFRFDGIGEASLVVPVPPALAGVPIYLQWYCYDSITGNWIFSNGLGVDVTP